MPLLKRKREGWCIRTGAKIWHLIHQLAVVAKARGPCQFVFRRTPFFKCLVGLTSVELANLILPLTSP